MGPLIPLALSLAPELGPWLFGANGEQTAQAVALAVRTVTGTSDDAAAQQAVASDPKVASQLRVQFAQIAAQQQQAARQTDLETLSAQLNAMPAARARTASPAKPGGLAQWAAPIVSIVVLVTFSVMMWALLTRTLPAGSETILNMLLGTLAAMATSVVGFWVGSSAGSERKTDLLYHSAPAAAPPSATGDKP